MADDRREGACVLAEARAGRSDAVARDVRRALAELRQRGERASFYAVAKRARVARSTLYRRADLKRLVVAAREGVPAAALSAAPPSCAARCACAAPGPRVEYWLETADALGA